MTNTTSNTPSAAVPAALPDPRPNFAAVVRIGHDVLAGIRADQLSQSTPCKDFTVDQLSGHLLAVINRIGVLGNGGDFFTTPPTIDDVVLADRPAAYAAFADSALDAWSADGALAQTITVPWGVLPGAAMLMVYINEISVHSWDLATATGQQPVWDGDALAMAFFAIQQGLPREGRSVNGDGADGGAPFAPVVDVATDAPLIDQLVGWNGRQP